MLASFSLTPATPPAEAFTPFAITESEAVDAVIVPEFTPAMPPAAPAASTWLPNVVTPVIVPLLIPAIAPAFALPLNVDE